MLSVRVCDDAHLWNHVLDAQKPHTFLQSWEWKIVNEGLAHKTFALGIFEGETLVGTALTIFMKARRGSFLLIPHGPVLGKSIKNRELRIENGDGIETEVWSLLIKEWRRIAVETGAVFVRLCPLSADTEANAACLRQFEFRPAPIHQHPELAWLLDVTRSEEELFKGLRKTTRQSIRKAEEAGMTVKFLGVEGLDDFWKVYEMTVVRQQFTPFSRQYLQTEIEAFARDGRVLVAVGRIQNIVVSSAIVVFAHGSAFYHHGASDQSHFPKVPAAHFLQWRIIQAVKRRGCQWYNFWGVVPEHATDHPWHGLSSFKRGFDGQEEAYLHAHDLPLSSRYWLTWLVETIRRKRRRL